MAPTNNRGIRIAALHGEDQLPAPLARASSTLRHLEAVLSEAIAKLRLTNVTLLPHLPPDDPLEDDAICRPGTAGLARCYSTTIEALLEGPLTAALDDLSLATAATLDDPQPLPRTPRLRPSHPFNELLLRTALRRLTRAAQSTSEHTMIEPGPDPRRNIRLKSERVQARIAALTRFHLGNAGRELAATFEFSDRFEAMGFINHLGEVADREGVKFRAVLEPGNSVVSALLPEQGSDGGPELAVAEAIERLFRAEEPR